MEQKTYEIIIETLVSSLEMERWRLRETTKELEATRQELACVRKEIEKMIDEIKEGNKNA